MSTVVHLGLNIVLEDCECRKICLRLDLIVILVSSYCNGSQDWLMFKSSCISQESDKLASSSEWIHLAIPGGEESQFVTLTVSSFVNWSWQQVHSQSQTESLGSANWANGSVSTL